MLKPVRRKKAQVRSIPFLPVIPSHLGIER
ncbi:Uncharacterised protein [Vibrio cholerae]|nr:Uncharacterised protein [Vibrio cholerae]